MPLDDLESRSASGADEGFVSRGGLKLAAALDAFGVDPRDRVCADLGCNVGGFSDCLLQRGARHVFAVDTGYGALAWKLRQDERVTTLERRNALHFDPHAAPGFDALGGCDLVVIDLGWTPQRHAIPAARRWLIERGEGRIITLIKPHYEQSAEPRPQRGRRNHRTTIILNDEQAHRVATRVGESMGAMGMALLGMIESPIRGGASKGKRGNVEYLALLKPAVEGALHGVEVE